MVQQQSFSYDTGSVLWLGDRSTAAVGACFYFPERGTMHTRMDTFGEAYVTAFAIKAENDAAAAHLYQSNLHLCWTTLGRFVLIFVQEDVRLLALSRQRTTTAQQLLHWISEERLLASFFLDSFSAIPFPFALVKATKEITVEEKDASRD
jgi:hypothetical protein